MAFPLIYVKKKLKELNTGKRRNQVVSREFALLTSFTNRTGAIILGIGLIIFGLACGFLVFIAKTATLLEKFILISGTLGVFVGPVIIRRSVIALGKKPRAHEFFYYDRTRVISGTTKDIGQTEIDQISRTAKPRRIEALLALSARSTEIPLASIESVEVHVEKIEWSVDKLTIKGNNSVIKVDIDALLPSMNFSGINGTAAFNSISIAYTNATGKSIPAEIVNL